MTSMRSTRPVLVTGAGSGIGRATAVRLAGLGHPVFAAARNDVHLAGLAALPGVTPLRLDVRDPAQVDAALDEVTRAGGLYGLVNNAGVGGIGPVASWTDAEVLDLFDVNVFGVVRMTRAFLPLVLEARGRVVIIGSRGGSVSMKFFGPYTMTKHALEAFVIALDGEVRPHGARAVILQPGGVKTGIGDRSLAEDRARLERAPAPFDRDARAILDGLDDEAEFDPGQPESAANRRPAAPEEVAAVVQEALDAEDPRLRWFVGTRWEGDRMLETLFSRIADANGTPSMRRSAEELTAMLRDALERNS